MIGINRKGLLAVAAGFLSNPAHAASTYLTCSIDGTEIKVTADEPNATVTIMVTGTPAPQRFNASFSPREVVFADSMIRYTLSRTDLIIVRETPRFRWVEKGKCIVSEVPKRAF